MKIRIWYNGGTRQYYVQHKSSIWFSKWETMRTFDRRPAIFSQVRYAEDFVKQLQEQAKGAAVREKLYKENSKVVMETEI